MQTKQIKYQVAIIFTLGIYLYYLAYRLRYTINPDSLILSISFFYAETHGFIALFLFFFQVWNPAKRKSSAPPSGLSIDIYILTYNEDISILRKTALACVNIKYPHKTYILDDGNRPELAKEAINWGCEYITRNDRINAKAGNMNNGLRHTKGEYVAIFDADFIPQSDFLDKTLGYFHDPQIAFVQTPHNYYNVDSFQFKIRKEKEESWNEQDVFYRLMMPCRDYWNSTFFCGTAAVFRRKALEDIGGFATGTITEDLQTTIILYTRGWKGVYHNEILASGLAAKDLKNYHTQKLRWAEGNISLFFRNNPLLMKGLSIPQRICFFAIIFGWLIGFPKFIYFIMPPVMILTGGYAIDPFDFSFIWRYLMFLAVIILGFKFASRGYGRVRYDECYNMMNFFILIRAALRNLFRMKSIFVVTGKSVTEPVNVFNITPQSFICLLCFTGVAWGSLKLIYGISNDYKGVGTLIFWSIVNGFLALYVIEIVTRPFYKRKEFRFIGAIPVQYSIRVDSDFSNDTEMHKVIMRRDTDGTWFHSITGLGVSKDLNEHGISFITFRPLPVDKDISLSLYLDQRVLHCKAAILYTTHTDYAQGKMFIYGARFEDLKKEETDLITQYCFNTILPRFLHKFKQKPSVLLKILFKLFNQEWLRKQSRKRLALPLIIKNGMTSLTSVTNDFSISGLSFASYTPFEVGTIVTMDVFTPFGRILAKGIVRQSRKIAAGHSYFIGVKFIQFSNSLKDILLNLTGKRYTKKNT